MPWLFVCFVRLQALTVFSLVSLVGVSVCCARSYVMSSLFGGFPGLVGGFRLRLPSRLV